MSLKLRFLFEALPVEVLGTSQTIPREAIYRNCSVFPVQPERLKRGSKVHLWVSGMSLSDCDTPLQSPKPPIFNPIFNPDHFLQRDHLNDSYCGKIRRLPPRVKRSRMSWVLFSKVEKRAGESRRMSFIKKHWGSIMNG